MDQDMFKGSCTGSSGRYHKNQETSVNDVVQTPYLDEFDCHNKRRCSGDGTGVRGKRQFGTTVWNDHSEKEHGQYVEYHNAKECQLHSSCHG